MEARPVLWIVVPCYNEEQVLPMTAPLFIRKLRELAEAEKISKNSRVLFVNDGSKDRTWEIIKELHKENQYVRGINLARNAGHQNAILAGMMTAREWADAVVTLDADLQDDIECIPQMVRHFEEGNDIVYGVKVSREADPFMKKFTAQAFYKLQNQMGVESVYNHADFRLMSRRALDMLSEYKEHNLYLRGLIPQIGLPHTTVNDVISERYAGSSKYTFGKMMGLALNGITAFSVKPLYAIFNIGLLFLIIAFIIGLYVAYSLIVGTAVQGWASLMLSIWLVGGFVLTSLGVIGTYIGKIYTEVKQRPLYHIQEILD
jgi:glycosyltransferase involved in cell wall biosynthesis